MAVLLSFSFFAADPMNWKTPALVGAGLIAAEFLGRAASARFAPPATTVGSLLVPGLTFLAGHYAHGRGGALTAVGNGVMASAVLHAAARFHSSLDLDLRTY